MPLFFRHRRGIILLLGMIGAVVIVSWSVGLIRSSGMTLLDMVPDPSLSVRIKEMLELNGDPG